MEGVYHLLFLGVFIFGLLIGSFLNVVVFRYNTGRSFSKGRSHCFSCGKQLHWYELIPVVSYLSQRGRCRSCKSVLSGQYIAVELLTAFLFTAVAFRLEFFDLLADPLSLLFWWIVTALLIVITIYDLRHTIIPDGLAFAVALLGITAFFLRGGLLSEFLLALGIALFFASLWYFSDGRAMGLGDAKLVFGLALLLPFYQALSAVMASFYFGAVIGVVLLLLKRKKVSLKSEIPFAPFLAAGFFAVFLLDFSFIFTI